MHLAASFMHHNFGYVFAEEKTGGNEKNCLAETHDKFFSVFYVLSPLWFAFFLQVVFLVQRVR
jgi:hypothetical protein